MNEYFVILSAFALGYASCWLCVSRKEKVEKKPSRPAPYKVEPPSAYAAVERTCSTCAGKFWTVYSNRSTECQWCEGIQH